MEFRGPAATDFDNVHSLNLGFLKLLQRDPEVRKCLEGLPAGVVRRLLGLGDAEAERLASTPFLLLSFRERDDDFWERLFSRGPGRDLFVTSRTPSDDLCRLISAGLGFVWQLARQNPYAARLICGASLHWCDLLAERTIFQVLAAAGTSVEILALRSGLDAELWTKLLESGTSREKQVRRAAHISALQSMLTRASMPDQKRLAAAACAVRAPALKVADQTES